MSHPFQAMSQLMITPQYLLNTLLPKIHNSTMDKKRQCLLCGSNKTYEFQSKKNPKTTYKNWYRFDGGYLCNICDKKRRREFMDDNDPRNTKAYPGEKFCSVCGSRSTKLDKNTGRPLWRLIKNPDVKKGRICYDCFLRQRRMKSIINPLWGVCNSEICQTARKDSGIMTCDYRNFNRCIACVTNYPKTKSRCPCCSGPLRMVPKKGKIGFTKMGIPRPIVYY